MGIEISRKEFAGLKSHQRDLVVFDNLADIKKLMHSPATCSLKEDIKYNRIIGGLWLFALTVAIGLRKFLPFF